MSIKIFDCLYENQFLVKEEISVLLSSSQGPGKLEEGEGGGDSSLLNMDRY